MPSGGDRRNYPDVLRRIRFKDPESGKTLVFITVKFALTAATVRARYKSRWQVELFFKGVEHRLRIKRFHRVSENAVKTQIWIGVSVYVLFVIVEKRLGLDVSLYTLPRILSITLFAKIFMHQTLDREKQTLRTTNNQPVESIYFPTKF